MPKVSIGAVEAWHERRDDFMLQISQENLQGTDLDKAIYYASLSAGSDGYLISGLIDTEYYVEFQRFAVQVPFLKLFKRNVYKWRVWLLIASPDKTHSTSCYEGDTKQQALEKAHAVINKDLQRQTLLLLKYILTIQVGFNQFDSKTDPNGSKPAPAYNQILKLKQ